MSRLLADTCWMCSTNKTYLDESTALRDHYLTHPERCSVFLSARALVGTFWFMRGNPMQGYKAGIMFKIFNSYHGTGAH